MDKKKIISGLDRTAKEELVKLLKEKKVKKKENLLETFFDRRSKPRPNAVQDKFFRSQATVRALVGGNGVGKTTSLIIELLLAHTRQHPYRDVSSIDKTWFICPNYHKINDYLDEVKKWCPPSKLPTVDRLGTPHPRRWIWPNGTTTTFFSADQDSMAFEGTNIDALFCDEPFPRSLYIAAYRGLRNNPKHFVVFAFTAVDEPWLYQDIYVPGMETKNKKIQIFQGHTYDNIENIDKEWLAEFEASLTEEERKVRIEGSFAVLQGRVFKEFDRRTHVIPYQKWPKDWPVWVRIDCHTRKPSTALWLGVTKDEELVVINEAEAPSLDELGDLVLDINAKNEYRVINIKMDNSGLSAGWSRDKRTAFDILREKGITVTPVKPKEKDVDDSILRIKRLLKPEELPNGEKRPKLAFMENCTGTIQQMELYGWKEGRHEEKTGKSEKVMKVNDDYIDPLRYGVMSRPCFHPSLGPISYGSGHQIKRNKSMLAEKLANYKEKRLKESLKHGRQT